MQRRVDLPVAPAVEADAIGVAGPDRDRRGAVPAREGGTGAEPGHASGLTDDLGRRECTASGNREQRRSLLLDQLLDLAFELVDPLVELGAAAEQLARDLGDWAIDLSQALSHLR